MAGEMAECKAMLGEYVCNRAMHSRSKLALAHQLARRFHGVRISISHLLRGRAGLALNQCTGEFDPVAAGSGDFERIKKKIVGGNFAMPWNFEVRVCLSVFAREQNVHHPWAGAAREETLDRGRHDFGFGLAGSVSGDQ